MRCYEALVRDESDLEDIAGCEVIEKGLHVERSEDVEEVFLPVLAAIGRHMYFASNSSVVHVSLPNLATVGDDEFLQSSTDLDPGCVVFGSNPSLETLALSGLSSVEGCVWLEENDSLGSVTLDGVTHLHGLRISSNPTMTTFNLPNLEAVDGSLPDFEAADGSLHISNNPSLIAFDLDSVEQINGDLTVENNDSLPGITGLFRLGYVHGSLTIQNNDCMSQEAAEAFAASIAVGGETTVEGNGTSVPCD